MTKRSDQNTASSRSPRYWRDELNFAEFPLAALDKNSRAESLVFEDRIYDKSARSHVTRRLTVSPSREFGLPTALDEEVLLGLIQLTAKGAFADRRLHFTRYELIAELGWSQGTKSYSRIDKSLRKWTGVTLYYDNAWRDHAEKAWVTEHFHVIDRATLLDRERRCRRLKQAPEDPTAGKSSIVWNELVFNSFEAGYIKKLDFAFLQSLRKPTSKRLYRFLGKRFYFGDTCSFELRNLACEHMGLSKSYSNSKLRERLGPAIEELTSSGFLACLPAATQFKRVRRGEWRVYFAKHVEKKRAARAPGRGPSGESRRRPDNGAEELLPPAARVYLESLSSEERKRIEQAAISAAKEGEKMVLQSLTNTEGPAYQAALGRMVTHYLRSCSVIKAA